MLFRIVPKPAISETEWNECFSAMLFRMVPKLTSERSSKRFCFSAMLFRMVPKPMRELVKVCCVLVLCCLE